MLKKTVPKPEWLEATGVVDIYSVSGCISECFADYINFWKHNGWWLFDSPEIIRTLAAEQNIDIANHQLFYYEVFEKEFDKDALVWKDLAPDEDFTTNVKQPECTTLEGFDVVTFSARTDPECSPISCNSLAKNLSVNRHCLFDTFEDAKRAIDANGFDKCEPGPYRIFAVYTLPA